VSFSACCATVDLWGTGEPDVLWCGELHRIGREGGEGEASVEACEVQEGLCKAEGQMCKAGKEGYEICSRWEVCSCQQGGG
jgi:hypothetical protein